MKATAKRTQCNRCAEYFNPRTLKGVAHLSGCRIHNGWKNYETWVVNLWISNDQASARYWDDNAREALEDAIERGNIHGFTGSLGEPESYAKSSLARRLKDEIENQMPTEGLVSDLVGAALSEVDWYELAGSAIDGCKPEKEEVARWPS